MEICDGLLVFPVIQDCVVEVVEVVTLYTVVVVHHNTVRSTRLYTQKSYPSILIQV